MPRRLRGGPRGAALARYESLCDPRLNARQSLDLAFRVAELMRAPEARHVSAAGAACYGRHRADRGVRRPGREARGRVRDRPDGIRTRARSRWRPSGARSIAAAGVSRRSGRGRRARARRGAGGARCQEQVAAVLEASRDECHGHGRRLDEGRHLRRRSPERARFIGGHPVCGSEARGPEHASAELFEGATWFLTPVAETEPERYKHAARLRRLARCDPGRRSTRVAHDRLLAIDEPPAARAREPLLNQAGAARVNGHEPLAAAGGSLKDMTRVAGANPRIWVDIFLDNADELRASLAEHRRRVEELERALAARRRGLARALDRRGGRSTAGRCSTRPTADAGALQRLRVHVPDRPGVFAGSPRRSAPSGSTSRTSSSSTCRPSAAARSTMLVTGRGAGAPRGGAPRGAGLLRHRRAGVRGRVGVALSVEPAVSPPRRHRRARRQVDLPPGAAARRDRGRRERDPRLRRAPPTRSRPPTAIARARGRGGRWTGDAVAGARAWACAAFGARRPDRLRQRRHADAAAARACSPGRRALRARRRRVALAPAARADRRAARARWALGSRRTDGHAPLVVDGGTPLRRFATSCRSRARR